MFIKLLVISLFLVTLVMLTLGVKLLFDRNAGFTVHSCSTDPGKDAGEDGCHSCQLKELADCSENKIKEVKTFK